MTNFNAGPLVKVETSPSIVPIRHTSSSSLTAFTTLRSLNLVLLELMGLRVDGRP
jgi:hypothetical protein